MPIRHYGWMAKKPAHPIHFIREWREYRGLTQVQLAGRVALGASAVSKIETGEKALMEYRLLKFAEAFNCSVPDLFEAPPDPEKPENDLTRHLRRLKTREDRAKAARILAAAFGGEEKAG